MPDPFLDNLGGLPTSACGFDSDREEEWEAMPAYCPWPVHRVIAGFPRYNFSVSSLPLDQRSQLSQIAALILHSFQPHCQPMLGVLIIGHADRDVQRGSGFEREISVKRALSARNALLAVTNRSTTRKTPSAALRSVCTLPWPPFV